MTVAITYTVTLLQPVLAAALEGDPASVVSYDFLPGSALRGAIIGAYLARQEREGRKEPLDPTKDEIRRLFFDGRTRYLNAYPLDRTGRRSVPTPRSWFGEKEDLDRGAGEEEQGQLQIYDFTVALPEHTGLQQPKMVSHPFCVPYTVAANPVAANTVAASSSEPDAADYAYDDYEDLEEDAPSPTVRLLTVQRQVSVHTQRDREVGSAHEGSGAVFRYEAIAPEQRFGGAILCSEAEDAAELAALLRETESWELGRSRRAGYGAVTMSEVKEHNRVWPEVEREESALPSDRLTVTLLSDAVLLDKYGRARADLPTLTRALEERLGPGLTCEESFAAVRETGGFNRAWGLPLLQEPSLRMGTTVVYRLPAGANLEALRRLEDEGIGERRAEGFGRLGLNWLTAESLTVEGQIREGVSEPVLEPASASGRLAETILSKILARRLEGKVVEAAGQLDVVQPPRRSQLSRLRLVVQEARTQTPQNGAKRILEVLEDIADRQVSRRQFERARIQGVSLPDWIQAVLGNDDDLWKALRWDPAKDVPRLGGIPAVADARQTYEIRLRMIDAVLARAAKLAQAKERADDGRRAG